MGGRSPHPRSTPSESRPPPQPKPRMRTGLRTHPKGDSCGVLIRGFELQFLTQDKQKCGPFTTGIEDGKRWSGHLQKPQAHEFQLLACLGSHLRTRTVVLIFFFFLRSVNKDRPPTQRWLYPGAADGEQSSRPSLPGARHLFQGPNHLCLCDPIQAPGARPEARLVMLPCSWSQEPKPQPRLTTRQGEHLVLISVTPKGPGLGTCPARPAPGRWLGGPP